MQFLSGSFMILWMIAFALYYLVPPKMQWYVLLAAGIIFYVAGTGGIPAALLLTAISTYGCGLFLRNNLEKQKEAVLACEGKEAAERNICRKTKKDADSLFYCKSGSVAFL